MRLGLKKGYDKVDVKGVLLFCDYILVGAITFLLRLRIERFGFKSHLGKTLNSHGASLDSGV